MNILNDEWTISLRTKDTLHYCKFNDFVVVHFKGSPLTLSTSVVTGHESDDGSYGSCCEDCDGSTTKDIVKVIASEISYCPKCGYKAQGS